MSFYWIGAGACGANPYLVEINAQLKARPL